MTGLIWCAALLLVLLVLRFVRPDLAHRAKDVVVRAKINRMVLTAEPQSESSAKRFSVLLGDAFRFDGAAVSTIAMQHRCQKLREFFAVLSTGEFERRAHPSVGNGLVELAAMMDLLGGRFCPGAEDRRIVVEAEDILGYLAEALSSGRPRDSEALEAWLATTPMSIVQIGEILIAGVFALTYREGAAVQLPSPNPPLP
jgi:hypothetical protein